MLIFLQLQTVARPSEDMRSVLVDELLFLGCTRALCTAALTYSESSFSLSSRPAILLPTCPPYLSRIAMHPQSTRQRLFRGSAARRRARQEREDEMIYIGMKPAESTLDELQRELDIAYHKRKQEQARAKPRGHVVVSREIG